jgi:alkyl hydroperoxide reductase subunit AhpC
MTIPVFRQCRSSASQEFPPAVSLPEWLGGHWGILFSHPGDFEQEQLERDRWLSVLRRSFSAHDVRAVAVARDGREARQNSHGWLAELDVSCAAVLAMAPSAEGALLDPRYDALRAEIAHGGARFAMIIDPDLRCRRAVRYRAPVGLPSPIELIGWVVALRNRLRPFIARRGDRPADSSLRQSAVFQASPDRAQR